MCARFRIALDGKVVAAAEPYDPIQTVEIETRIDPGRHRIVVEGEGVAGPSAVFLQLELVLADGSRQSIVSDATWRGAGAAAAGNLGPIDRRLVVPASRRVGIDVVDNYEQWKQALGAQQGTDPATFSVAPGFEIQLVRSALPEEDSWVSLAIDPQGRLVIAKEKQGLLRMTLSQDGNTVIGTESIDDTLKECRGLAFIDGDLYANANNSKGLYRLRRRGDKFSPPELLYASSGAVGHGRNDLAVSPEGKLHSIHGDAVDLPVDAIDDTSPFREARQGQKTNEGHLLRLDRDDGSVELLAAGLRNPFGIDFNADGEIFTYDADAEYDMGSPWYRPTRVSHLVTGGDYGWRGVTNSWPPYYPDHPDNARPNLDIGKGSPTAVKFGTRSHFPAPYREALFILDWAYGRVIAVHMVPRGSSYLMAAETFLKGRPLNVTDLDFGPDGSMYLVTGGRKTQSALYRVRYVGGRAEEPQPVTPMQKISERFAENSRKLRRDLEARLAQPPNVARLARTWKYLSNADPWIRQAAGNLIERHPVSIWQMRALAETEITPAVHALTALARSGQHESYPAILGRLNELLPSVDSRDNQLAALYAYWLCVQAVDDIDDKLKRETIAVLSDQYPSQLERHQSYAANRLLSEILVKLEAQDVVSKTIRLFSAASDQVEQMHYLYVLRNVRWGWSIDDRRAFFSGLAQTQHYRGGAGMRGFLNKIRGDAVATLDETERQQLGALIEETAPTEETVETQSRPLVRKWTVDDLLQPETDVGERDRSRGAKVFAAARCIGCHRFGAHGVPMGPDLTAVSRRFSRRDLLHSIIEPSKVIAENYRSLQVVTSDGKAYVGQATLSGDYRSPILRLSTDPTQPLKAVEIPKSEIESQKLSSVSWMPDGLLDTLTRDEILDLIAYLESAP
jgi:putative heme-binding domain-containing protein